MKLTEHTYAATGITAAELDTSTLPAEFVDRLIEAAFDVARLIGNCAIVPANDDDTDSDAVATKLTDAMSEAWIRYGQPTAVDFDVVRESLNERHALEAAYNDRGAATHDGDVEPVKVL